MEVWSHNLQSYTLWLVAPMPVGRLWQLSTVGLRDGKFWGKNK